MPWPRKPSAPCKDHELIKVRATAADRVARDAPRSPRSWPRTGSTLVHRIGHVAVLYRANASKPGLIIPDPKPWKLTA